MNLLFGLLIFVEACTSVVPLEPEETPPEPLDVPAQLACDTDLDCGTGGCSGQICGNKAYAEGSITTCEFQPIYGCYQQTSCSCVNNGCRWLETDAYKQCLAEIP